jgi:hypothetical protein
MSVLVCTYSSYLYSLPVLTSYNTEGVPGLPIDRVNSWSARPTTRYLSITQGPFLFGLLRTVFSVVAYMARLAPYTGKQQVWLVTRKFSVIFPGKSRNISRFSWKESPGDFQRKRSRRTSFERHTSGNVSQNMHFQGFWVVSRSENMTLSSCLYVLLLLVFSPHN